MAQSKKFCRANEFSCGYTRNAVWFMRVHLIRFLLNALIEPMSCLHMSTDFAFALVANDDHKMKSPPCDYFHSYINSTCYSKFSSLLMVP